MNKEFIPYEEALALKELGFDEPCLDHWYSKDKKHKLNFVSGGVSDFDSFIKAPLYQQAFRWFREEHSLFHNIWNCTHGEPTTKIPWGFAFSIDEDWVCIVGKKDGVFKKYYNTYEEAELECLRTLIKIAKEKK